jgi:hypothetical protein
VLECSFSATITTARCVSRSSAPSGADRWTIEVAGQLTGCGEEVAFVALDDEAAVDSCGSWDGGVFGGCIPPDDNLSDTSWSVTRTIERPSNDTPPVSILVWRGHANVTLATSSVSCVP